MSFKKLFCLGQMEKQVLGLFISPEGNYYKFSFYEIFRMIYGNEEAFYSNTSKYRYLKKVIYRLIQKGLLIEEGKFLLPTFKTDLYFRYSKPFFTKGKLVLLPPHIVKSEFKEKLFFSEKQIDKTAYYLFWKRKKFYIKSEHESNIFSFIPEYPFISQSFLVKFYFLNKISWKTKEELDSLFKDRDMIFYNEFVLFVYNKAKNKNEIKGVFKTVFGEKVNEFGGKTNENEGKNLFLTRTS